MLLFLELIFVVTLIQLFNNYSFCICIRVLFAPCLNPFKIDLDLDFDIHLLSVFVFIYVH